MLGGSIVNVWFVNQYAVPPDAPGGTRHYGLGKELVGLGHNVVIFASTFNHSTRTQRQLRSTQVFALEKIGGVDFVWIRTPGYVDNGWSRVRDMLMFSWRLLCCACRLGLRRPDVVVGSSPHLFGAFGALVIARRLKVPFVFEVRDLWPQSLVDVGGISPRHPFIVSLEIMARYLYRSADNVVCVGQAMGEHIRPQMNRKVDVTWIPNGIDMGIVPAPEPSNVEGAFTVVYAGAHGLADGLDLILDAAKILQEPTSGIRVRFLLVGDGPEKPRLMQRALSLGLPNVEFRPAVPKSQLYDVLREGHAFVVVVPDSPAYRYGASFNKFFDYLAMARPTIIASASIPGNPFATSESGMVIPPGDPRALAEAVKRLASMPDSVRWAMGLKGREYVERHHAFSVLARKYEEVLVRSIERRRWLSTDDGRAPGFVGGAVRAEK